MANSTASRYKTTIPAYATAPTGRPHPLLAADAIRKTVAIADRLAADAEQAREHAPASPLAALPSAVSQAMQAALPEAYTPGLAAEIAQGIAARLIKMGQDEPARLPRTATLTALPEFGLKDPEVLHLEEDVCPETGTREISINSQGNGQLFTPAATNGFLDRVQAFVDAGRRMTVGERLAPEERTLLLDEDMGAWTTVPVETALRDLDSDAPGPANMPWLAAQVVVSDYRPEEYGRTTRVWVHYGITTGELSPAEARAALEAMRGFVGQLEDVVALAEETALDDYEATR